MKTLFVFLSLLQPQHPKCIPKITINSTWFFPFNIQFSQFFLPKLECKNGKVWDSTLCQCVCPRGGPSCAAGKERCQETCECQCINREPKEGCAKPLIWDNDKCECTCPADKQMPAGGCGAGKS